MKTSNIDKGFVEIINSLNANGYKPVFSCDGVIAHHNTPDDVTYAYITFLESPKIYSLLAIIMEYTNFMIEISTSAYISPYEMYGNEISGILYSVYFDNQDGTKTKKFERLVKRAIKEKIVPKEEYLPLLLQYPLLEAVA